MTIFSQTGFSNQIAENESHGLLTVEVVNGTANGAAVTNDEVIVQIFQHNQLFSSLEVKVSADGRALFENIPTGEHVMAIARAEHQDMMFSGPVVSLNPAEDKFTTNVKVFDVTVDQSKLSVKNHHFIIKTHPEFLEITEFMQLSNSTDMAISSDKKDSLGRPIVIEIMLPKDFKNLKSSSYFEDHALVQTEDGFYDTMAVPPGEYQVAFSYTLDITSSAMDIIKKITLPTSHFMAFIDSGEAQFHGLSEMKKKAIDKNGVPTEYFRRENLAPTDVVAFRIVGLHARAKEWVTWVTLAVVFGVLVILAIVRSRPTKS
jgi:hypothetical protein